MLQIDIYSDTICPWCYIGKRRLERALAQRPELESEVRWRAFQLNPDMPPEGIDRQRYLETKFGGTAGARQVYARVEAAGSGEDIPFAFDAIPRTPNTVDSHRLILWAAGQPGGQDAVVESLFRAYFLDGRDIGDREVLVAVAAAAGHDANGVRAFLASDEGATEVREEDLQGRQSGIQGVPLFVLGRRYALSGAQPPEVFLEVLDRIAAEDASAESPPGPAGVA